MNPRIQELAKQVGMEPEEETEGIIWWLSNSDLEKFAELIVRQCGYYADVFESLGCPVDMDTTETKPSDYIKKYFGVEE
jgi:hypothetical protein